jgi:hypothetical protein
MSRLPHFLDSQLTGGAEVVGLMHWWPFTLRKMPSKIESKHKIKKFSYVCPNGEWNVIYLAAMSNLLSYVGVFLCDTTVWSA